MNESYASAPQSLDEQAAEPAALGSSSLWAIWTRRWLVAKAMVVGAVVLAIVSLLIPNRYESTVRLMPPDEKSSGLSSMMANMGAASSLGMMSGLLGGGQSSGLLVGIVRSRTVQDALIDRFDLRKVYKVKYKDDARRQLLENTSLSVEDKSGIIAITVTDTDPRRAAEMANAYADELGRVLALVGTSAARRERIFLEDRLKAVKEDVDSAARSLSAFSSKSGTLDIGNEGQAILGAAGNLQGRLIATEAEMQGLREIYTANNPRVRSAAAQAGELRRQLDKLSGVSGGKQDAGAAEEGTAYPSIRQLPILGQTYSELYRRTKVEESIFETLSTEYEIAKVQEAKDIQKVKILDVGLLPEKKSFPPRTLFTVIGGVLGAGLAMGWVIFGVLWRQYRAGATDTVLADEVWASLVGMKRLWRFGQGHQ